MAWPPSSADNQAAFEEDGQWLELKYRCTDCDVEWEDEWSCEVDGECDKCGTLWTPYESKEVDGPE